MWVDSTKSYKTTCNNSDASIRFEVSCKFEKTHQKVDQQCPMKEMYLKLRIKRRFKQKHLVRMPLGYPGFIVFSHGLITSISNTFHAGPASSCVSGIDLRVPKVISQQNQVPMLWASNNFLSILIGARLCMKHAKCFVCPGEHSNKVCFLKRFSQIPACDTIADQWSGNTCSWPSGLGQLRDSMDRILMGRKSWLLPWDPRQDSWTENGYEYLVWPKMRELQQITIYFQVKWVFPWRMANGGNFSILPKIF